MEHTSWSPESPWSRGRFLQSEHNLAPSWPLFGIRPGKKNNLLEPEHTKCTLRGVTSTETKRSHVMSQSPPWQSREGRPEDRLIQTDRQPLHWLWLSYMRLHWVSQSPMEGSRSWFHHHFSLCVKWGHLIASPSFPGFRKFSDAVQECETSAEHENPEIRQGLIWFLLRYRPVWTSSLIWNQYFSTKMNYQL